MSNTINPVKLRQIEKGDELKDIGLKAFDSEVVHKKGDETIEDDKKFLKNPTSEADATSDKGLVRKGQMDVELGNKANDNQVVKIIGVQDIDDEKTFLKAPKSAVAASTDQELVRKKEHDAQLSDKVDTSSGKSLMLDSDKDKLDSIQEGAEKNKVDSVNTKTGAVVLGADDIEEGSDRKWASETSADVTANNTSADSDKLGGKLPAYYAKDSEVVKSSQRGVPGGHPGLNSQNKIAPEHLPETSTSVVTGALISSTKFENKEGVEVTPEDDTIYIDSTSGLQYVWNGTEYQDISGTDLQIGVTSTTAGRGDHAKEAYDHSKKTSGNPHNVSKSDLSLDNVTNDAQLKKASNLSDLPSKSAARTNLGLGSAAVENKSFFAKPADIKNGKLTIKQDGEADKTFSANQDGNETVTIKNTTYDPATQGEDGLLSKEDKEKLDNSEFGGQKNVQPDFLELDSTSDAYIKAKQGLTTIEDEFTYNTGDSLIFNTDFEAHGSIEVFRNGQKLIKQQFDERHNGIEFLGELDIGENITLRYDVETDWNAVHGFEFDRTIAAPEVQSIGNSSLNASLPIQSQMKRCLINDDGSLNYFLDDDDSTKKEDLDLAVLDGTDGQVMVRVPRHFVLDNTVGNFRRRLYSTKPFLGAQEVPEYYISAYKAALDRANNKLSSVVNDSVDFRGGGNQSAWDSDNQFKTQLGKAVTSKSRIDFRNYAKNRGADWYDMDYFARESVAWLITHEFGTRNHQADVSEGATTTESSDWAEFNDRHPLFVCGITNNLGNKTGEKVVTLQDYPSIGQTEEIKVFSYRGIENFWGDIWEWTNGVNVLDNKYYSNPPTRKKTNNTDVGGLKLIGDKPLSSSYIKEMHEGSILPSTTGASSSTHYTDQIYASDAAGLRGLLFGGTASDGSPAGSFCVNAHIAPASARSYIGSRLCFFSR